MSIPKEPRQLMINLMYLVLTALLALNVSAEVMNAFFSLDRGIIASSAIVEDSNRQTMAGIELQADSYKDSLNQKYLDAAKQAEILSADLVEYVQAVRDTLFSRAGGPNPDHPEQPKRKKDKDVTTRYLVLGDPGTPEDDGKGFELEQKIRETREALLALVDNNQEVANGLPLGIEDWENQPDDGHGEKTSWADFKFRQMPVAAVFPMLSKMQSDTKASEAAILNHIFSKMTGEKIVFDGFEPVVSARKGYVIRGEKYEAEVFLSAYSTSAGDNTKIYVNGSQLDVESGRGTYTSSASSIGTKKYNVKIEVTNPVTGEVKEYAKEFEYEVGERSVTVSADKMNVFYIGVDNPVSVSAAGISTNDLRVSINGGGGSISKTGSANYNVKVTAPTDDCRVNVSGGGMSDSKVFRVKRIPDPVARLGNKQDGAMGNGTFKAQQGLIAWLDNFDFDAKCNIQGFRLVRVPKRQDPIEVVNSGGSYKSEAKRIVGQAKPGDTFYFFDVKARCPGDKAGRKVNSLVFNIK
ncbi:MAG: gliding motility protein GldM [Bacteroidetes bacterium]|nr:gliding motility protein GldM [Bacteroidota bacterium]